MISSSSRQPATTTQTGPVSKSQARIVWEQFRKHQLAVLGGLIVLTLYVGALFAPFIAPYGSSERDLSYPTRYHPPTKVYFRDPQTGAVSWPFVYATSRRMNPDTFQFEYAEDRSTRYPVQFFMRRPDVPYTIVGPIQGDLRLFGVDKPARIFIAGADGEGRDLFSRIWFGARISLTIGIVAISLSFVLGLFFGGLAGYYGGWVDNIIMRIVEVIGAIPTLYLLITLTAFLPRGLDPVLVFYGIIFMLGLIGWGGLARTVRSQILALREVDYVQAATALGARESRIIFRHMLPTTISFLIVSASLAIPGAILGESGLSFIGLGIREPYASWGLLLNDITVSGFASFNERPWTLIPGFFIVVAILSWNFLGDGLRDAFDPRKRQ
jgi:peptide/nickel transport system permease protein